ncbi:helix-turn-helix transcriptional regulator [Herbaspirillum seropedicae]|uniref:HTH cro/C1-type domain-containing protein n=1 Tax=Herbaspirillum seropedicae (strain SmR1) TaxID=757424 RepID=D8ITC1_HERSS|nr:helix-turn-helix transcriptional regulator [Herbaspirillum seropedicae]ADJ65551.1 conserved hypothetical protein [Herbaspirillum seropedicae SmR1]AKN67380.1 hypothetical protein ACP92_20395 [Herbaspirillum seropedicae]NQE31973.1 hypothetical protein [Herbaspirillum seropedicae]UMU23387.1 helix-turn-helix transcriptional regulator [Herbaspirillum seropedicae]
MESEKYRYHEKLFLKQLREARESANVKQTELSEALGEYQSYVSKVETGERRLDVIELIAWCEALGVEADDFVKKLRQKLEEAGEKEGLPELKQREK